jgi:arylsulfatase
MDARRGATQPFLAWIALNAPHAPLDVPQNYLNLYTNKTGTNLNTAKFFGMIANIDDNFGSLLNKLREWNLETNTLVIFMTDNGGTTGVPIFNAGMRGAKVTPYLGGIRVPSIWRWPGGFTGGIDCDKLTAHIDLFPTFAEIVGAKLDDKTRKQVEGRSLLPLLKNPNAEWRERTLVTHVGRWDRGRAGESAYRNCSIRNSRFQMVSIAKPTEYATKPRWELFDLSNDRGEKTNVFAKFPEAGRELAARYDEWWREIQPMLVNEDVPAPDVNPFKALFWKQFGGGPDEKLQKQMDPVSLELKR